MGIPLPSYVQPISQGPPGVIPVVTARTPGGPSRHLFEVSPAVNRHGEGGRGVDAALPAAASHPYHSEAATFLGAAPGAGPIVWADGQRPWSQGSRDRPPLPGQQGALLLWADGADPSGHVVPDPPLGHRHDGGATAGGRAATLWATGDPLTAGQSQAPTRPL
ncbi:MAG: hypothetical protein ACE5R6_07505 [Candidatus Heimdallarchaeota archaeon]